MDIRELVALHLKTTPDRLDRQAWARLEAKGYPQECEVRLPCLSGEADRETTRRLADSAEVADLAEDYRAELEQADARRPGQEKETLPAGRRLDALARILAIEAERRPDVRSLRRHLLGGRLLDPADVEAWLECHAEGAKGGEAVSLAYGVPGDEHERVLKVARESSAGHVKAIAAALSDAYPWPEPYAVAFLLTGKTPPPVGSSVTLHVRYSFPALSRVEMYLDPRLSPDEVAELYKRARREMGAELHTMGESPMGFARDNPMREKSLELAVFTARTRQEGTWPERRELWNAEHPEWVYELSDPNAKRFSWDCREAWTRVTGAKWPRERRRREYT